MKHVALVIALAFIAAACDRYPALRTHGAPLDAQRAVAAGDCRLVGVYGLTTETPGAPYEEKVRRGVRVIEGTSDEPDGPAAIRLNDRARRYAERYNREVLARCPSTSEAR
jgi:hypothetical protein